MDLKFTYTGAALVRPLRALLSRQGDKLGALDAKIATFSGAVLEAAQRPANLMRPTQHSTEEMAAASILRDRQILLIGRRESELMLFEALRTPEATWSLTLSDISLLYSDLDLSKEIAA